MKLLLCVFACLALSASAAPMWGKTGHAVTAQIAQNLMDPSSLQAAESLLGGVTLVSIASWADDVRHTAGWEWSAPLHFINTPAWSCDFVYSRDCSNNMCVAGAITNYTQRLMNESLSQSERAIALKFLVHFHGDIHQPLHCGFGVDKGGNDITGHFYQYADNLHAIWDDFIITDHINQDFGGNQDDWVSYLMNQIKGNWSSKVSEWRKCSSSSVIDCPNEWGDNSASLACTYAYTDSKGDKIKNGFELAQPYFDFTKGIVDQQLVKGGVRLADTLDKIFGGGAQMKSNVPPALSSNKKL